MYTQSTPSAWDGVYPFLATSSERLLLSSRIFLIICFYFCHLFFSERFLCHIRIQRPDQVFLLKLQHLWEAMHVGHFMEDRIQPHGYEAGPLD